MPTGVDWLEQDKEYTKQVVRLSGIRVALPQRPEGSIEYDVVALWDGDSYHVWNPPYAYSLPSTFGRLIWYGSPNRLFTMSLGLLTDTFKEMGVPTRNIAFSGYIDPHDKKIYYQALSLKKPTSMPADLSDRIWIRQKLMKPETLLAGMKALQEDRRRLKGWGYEN